MTGSTIMKFALLVAVAVILIADTTQGRRIKVMTKGTGTSSKTSHNRTKQNGHSEGSAKTVATSKRGTVEDRMAKIREKMAKARQNTNHWGAMGYGKGRSSTARDTGRMTNERSSGWGGRNGGSTADYGRLTNGRSSGGSGRNGGSTSDPGRMAERKSGTTGETGSMGNGRSSRTGGKWHGTTYETGGMANARSSEMGSRGGLKSTMYGGMGNQKSAMGGGNAGMGSWIYQVAGGLGSANKQYMDQLNQVYKNMNHGRNETMDMKGILDSVSKMMNNMGGKLDSNSTYNDTNKIHQDNKSIVEKVVSHVMGMRGNKLTDNAFQDVYKSIMEKGDDWLKSMSRIAQNVSVPMDNELAKLVKIHNLMAVGKFTGVFKSDQHNITTNRGDHHKDGVQVCMCL